MDRPIVFDLRSILRKYLTIGNLPRAKFEAVSRQNHRTGTEERQRYVNSHNLQIIIFLSM
jgi:hypothetical protein